MVHLECIPLEDKDTAQKDQNVPKTKWMCSVENGPWFETTLRIVTSYGEQVVVADPGAVFVADVEIVIVNKDKGYTRIWLVK